MPDKKSPLTNYLEKLNAQAKQSENNKTVIPDECGDSLWDDVLRQQEERDRQTGKASTAENKTNTSPSEQAPE